MARHLTDKQQRFLAAFLGPAKGNATEAARLAGYKGNRVTLAQIGSKTRRRPLIIAVIEVDMEVPPGITFWSQRSGDRHAVPT
jgi:phage terminase small subunit